MSRARESSVNLKYISIQGIITKLNTALLQKVFFLGSSELIFIPFLSKTHRFIDSTCQSLKSNTSFLLHLITNHSSHLSWPSTPHLPILSFPSCFQTSTLSHHPAGTVSSMCPAIQVPCMGQDHSEHTCEALTSASPTAVFSWFAGSWTTSGFAVQRPPSPPAGSKN